MIVLLSRFIVSTAPALISAKVFSVLNNVIPPLIMPKYIDLHSHSTASDGSDSPSLLVKKAKNAGLAALALTDHDTIDGLDEARLACLKYELDFVPGCEIAVSNGLGELHLLGLYVPSDCEDFNTALAREQRLRDERNKQIVEKLQGLNLNITLEEVEALAGGPCCGRPHIACCLVKKGYVKNSQEAFDLYIAQGKIAYVPRDLRDAERGIASLKEAGATAVLAHPCLSKSMNAEGLEKIVKKYKDYGLDSIEVFHSSHSAKNEKLCLKLAKKYELLISGGSDYHGPVKPHCQVGYSRNKNRVSNLFLEKIKEDRIKKSLPLL